MSVDRSLDDLIRPQQQRLGDREAERLRGFQVDDSCVCPSPWVAVYVLTLASGDESLTNFHHGLIGPLVEGGLDEALGLAVRARSVRPREEVANPEPLTGLAKAPRSIARAVIRHDGPHAHPDAGGAGP